MKRMRILTKVAFVSRSLWVIAAVAIFCAVPLATTFKAQDDEAANLFYTTSSTSSTGNAEVFAIRVSRSRKVTTRDIGSTGAGSCISLALSPSRTLYSMCGPLFGAQYLATIDPKTGAATQVNETVSGLAVMAIAFAPNGTLYAVGDCNFSSVTSDCAQGSDPNYNSLYTVNVTTGAFTRVGSTGAPQFFMDLAFDRSGNMFGVTTTINFNTGLPAVLYRIDPATGTATKPVNLVGSNSVMGIAFGRDGKLYATDFAQNPGLYLIDINTGFETPIAALPFGLSSALELVNPHED
jgi:DNA-binding beta-propeller fold protein YncE